MGDRPEPQFHPPKPGDGTLTSKKPYRPANWFGPSLEPQEEFVGDHPNRREVHPPPVPPKHPSESVDK